MARSYGHKRGVAQRRNRRLAPFVQAPSVHIVCCRLRVCEIYCIDWICVSTRCKVWWYSTPVIPQAIQTTL